MLGFGGKIRIMKLLQSSLVRGDIHHDITTGIWFVGRCNISKKKKALTKSYQTSGGNEQSE